VVGPPTGPGPKPRQQRSRAGVLPHARHGARDRPHKVPGLPLAAPAPLGGARHGRPPLTEEAQLRVSGPDQTYARHGQTLPPSRMKRYRSSAWNIELSPNRGAGSDRAGLACFPADTASGPRGPAPSRGRGRGSRGRNTTRGRRGGVPPTRKILLCSVGLPPDLGLIVPAFPPPTRPTRYDAASSALPARRSPERQGAGGGHGRSDPGRLGGVCKPG